MELIGAINYQDIVDIVASLMRSALPIAVIFGFVVKLVNLFLSLAFGKEKIDL